MNKEHEHVLKMQHDFLQRLHATFRDDISAKHSSFALLIAIGEYAGALIASHAEDNAAREMFVNTVGKAVRAGMNGYDDSLTLLNTMKDATGVPH